MLTAMGASPDGGQPAAPAFAIATGHVRSAEDGKPLTNVELALDAFPEKPIRTDAEGAFRLERIAPGMHDLLARAKGRLPGRLQLQSFAAMEKREVDLALTLADLVEGHVRGADGQPLAGVQLSARADEAATTELSSSKTGADGAFRLEGLPRGLAWIQIADARGVAAQAVLVPSTGVEIALARACTIEGEVVAAGGDKPAVGVEVVLQPEIGKVQRFTTKEDGRFSFSEIGSGLIELSARVAGARAYELFHSTRCGCPKDLKMRLRPSGAVQGIVTAADDGQPISGARILNVTRWEATAVGEEAGVSTDADGHFLVEGVFASRWLSVTAPGFATRLHQVPTRWSKPGVPQINFKLYRQLWLRGRVLGGDGRPVRAFEICDEYLGDRRALRECQAVKTGDDGSFEIHRDDPRSPPSRRSASARMAIVSRGFELLVAAFAKAGQLWDLGEVTLQSAPPLAVHVVDAQGSSIVGARVEQGEAGISWDWVGDSDGTGVARVFPHEVPMRPTCFRASHPLHPTARISECLYSGGKARAELTLTLPAASWIVGRVLDANGAVAGATIVDLKHEGLSAVSDAAGKYRLGPLEEGAHAPAVSHTLPTKQARAPVDGVEAADRIDKLSVELRAGEEKTVDLPVDGH